MSKCVCIGMGEISVTSDPEVELTCLGLGSCIAICTYDARRHIGGMVHVVLPTSPARDGAVPAKYADTAIPLLVEQLAKNGSRPADVRVVLCGGAAIFAALSGAMDIGQRNLLAVRAGLQQIGMKIIKEDVGGRNSRTVTLSVSTGQVRLRTVQTGEFVLADLGDVR